MPIVRCLVAKVFDPAEELSQAELSQIQEIYLKYFDRGVMNKLDRCDAAIYNTRLWYAAVVHFLEHKLNKTGNKDK